MSRAELIYFALIVVVGLPAAWRNLTAAALVLSYAFMQGSWYGFHIAYPPLVCILTDVTVIALIYCKAPARDCFPYRDWRAHLCAFWLEKTLWDRVVLLLFPVGWAFYLYAANAWWPLYWVSLAQLLAAAAEPLEAYRTRMAKRDIAPGPAGLLFSGVGVRGYG